MQPLNLSLKSGLSRITLALACSFSVIGSQLAYAQIQDNDIVQESSTQVEVITVKSERRIKRLQDIPSSMTALSADDLEAKAVTRLDDLAFASPGLTITDAGVTQSVNIRGIGLSSGDPDVTNGVGTYIDGLFQPPIVSTLDFYDVEYIQVLRGPQGTFAGANSTGGAILVDSKRPELDGDLGGFTTLNSGNYGAYGLKAALHLPVSDQFAARIAVNYKQRDSFYDSVGTADTNAGSLDEKSVRIGLLWEPIESLNFYLKYETTDKDSGGYAYRPIAGTEYAADRTDSIRKISFNSPTGNEESADTLLLDINYEFENGIALKWVAGDQSKNIVNLYDYDASTLGDAVRTQIVGEEQISHEFNIVSPASDKFEWVVGAYYQKNEVTVDIDNGPFPTEIDIQNEKITKGLFGQIGYYLTDDLQLEVGVRKITFDAGVADGSGVIVGRGILAENGIRVADIAGSYEDDDALGKVSLNWRMTDNHNLYGYIAKGYKPGGINSATSTFDAEEVIAYEGGWKGTLFDRALNGSVSLFYNDYENFQNTNINMATGRLDVSNIAAATIKGVEVAVNGHVGDLKVDFSMSYVNSSLNPTAPIINTRLSGEPALPQCTASQEASSGTCFDFTPYIVNSTSGASLYSPEFSFTTGAEYTFVLNNGAELTPRLNYAWIGEQWTNLIYDESTDLLASRGLLSATLTYQMDEWKIQAYGKNLANKEYVSGQMLNNNTEFYGAPRTFGIDVNYQF